MEGGSDPSTAIRVEDESGKENLSPLLNNDKVRMLQINIEKN